MSEEELKRALIEEAERIEEDALHSGKGHFNAAESWQHVRWWLGIPAVVIAAWAGFQAMTSFPLLASLLALFAAALSAVITFLDPEKRAAEHQNAGREFNALKNAARKFREIDILTATPERAELLLNELFRRRDDLNRLSPDVPRKHYETAKKDIDEGRATYRTDGDKQ